MKAACTIRKAIEDDVEQRASRRQKRRRASGLGQREQTLDDVRVVLEHAGRRPDDAVARDAAQPPVDEVDVEEQARGFACRVEEIGALEQDADVGERRDRQAVPRGDHLVVATWLRPLRAGGEQSSPHVVPPLFVIGVAR
jgi:hypothetical protein